VSVRAGIRHAAAVITACLVFALPRAQAGDDPAIWEMRGASASILLLGSVHLLRESDYPLPGNITAAVDQAECLVFELDIDDLDPLVSQSLLESLGRMPDGESLRDMLSPEDYDRAAMQSRELGIELDILGDFKPWFAALTLMNLQLMRLGFVPQLGLEQQLAAAATASGKDVLGLETLEFQLSLFDNLPDDTQAQLLLQTLEEAGGLEAQMGSLVSAWRQGQTGVLANELRRNFAGYPDLYRSLVTERNIAWADKIIDLGRGDRPCLVVVGALHLVGDGSVIELLRQRGVQVHRWPAAP
jgi:hypothetical protein